MTIMYHQEKYQKDKRSYLNQCWIQVNNLKNYNYIHQEVESFQVSLKSHILWGKNSIYWYHFYCLTRPVTESKRSFCYHCRELAVFLMKHMFITPIYWCVSVRKYIHNYIIYFTVNTFVYTFQAICHLICFFDIFLAVVQSLINISKKLSDEINNGITGPKYDI